MAGRQDYIVIYKNEVIFQQSILITAPKRSCQKQSLIILVVYCVFNSNSILNSV